jgi:hypothetical protein
MKKVVICVAMMAICSICLAQGADADAHKGLGYIGDRPSATLGIGLSPSTSLRASGAEGASLRDSKAGPWVGAVFFYWYTWDRQAQWGGWEGGVHYTPLQGYYDSPSFEDNLHSMWVAAEWGVTHFFMDYWSREWLDNQGQPRDVLVVRAAEELRRRGYPIWMSYYQDGENFAMRDFARNITEQRDVWRWLKLLAPSEVWPALDGRPFQMVYGRSGSPEVTIDNEGFRSWLKAGYGPSGSLGAGLRDSKASGIESLNRDWGSRFENFDQIEMDLETPGPQRAAAVEYQALLWQKDWEKFQEAARREFGVPGVAVSFDVGYGPYGRLSYSDFVRIFGGPHSYGGIFGQPHELDSERYIQAAIAKRYNTIFFDHLKNCYADWNTEGRIPGTEYPADPLHYERFWVGNLMRRNMGLLHMSWNEWWEGSNLEPSVELGKRFCEENLFYSTLMQLAFPSLRDFGRRARVAVVIDDHAFRWGSADAEELHPCVDALRKTMLEFDVAPEELVTDRELSRFDVVVAPSGAVGFGRNAEGREVADVLLKWVSQGGSRKLIASRCPELDRAFGVESAELPQGGDLSHFVDVGAEGDRQFLVAGFSQRQEGDGTEPTTAKEPKRKTYRWTPGRGRTTALRLPLSPRRSHSLIFHGTAIWPNKARVELDGQALAELEIKPGSQRYEVKIPAETVGSRRCGELRIIYSEKNVPEEKEPDRYKGERRVCNLMLEWVFIATENMPFSAKQAELRGLEVRLKSAIHGPIAGRSFESPWPTPPPIRSTRGEAVSSYQDGAPHALLLKQGEGSVIYVNGRLDIPGAPYLESLISDWARMNAPTRLTGDSVLGCDLRAGDTHLLLAYNRDIKAAKKIKAEVQVGSSPVAEVLALRRDGSSYDPVKWTRRGGRIHFQDSLRYCAVYQVVPSPVRLTAPELVVQPGETRRVAVSVENISETEVRGTLDLVSAVPSISAQARDFNLGPGEKRRVLLALTASQMADWGRKTVALRVRAAGAEALFFRQLIVERSPELELTSAALNVEKPEMWVENRSSRYISTAPAREVELEIAGRRIPVGTVAANRARRVNLAVVMKEVASSPSPELTVILRHKVAGQDVAVSRQVQVLRRPENLSAPAGALEAVHIFNLGGEDLEAVPVARPLTGKMRQAANRIYAADSSGRPVPWQVDKEGSKLTLAFVGSVHARSSATYFICAGSESVASPRSDLRAEAKSLGTGKGALEISNARFSLRLSEAKGGTAVSLRSSQTGAEYGAESFGAAYGSWGSTDPLHPAHTADSYISEEKVRQADSKGKISLVLAGPARVVAEVEWSDGKLTARQRYEVWAGAPWITIESRARPRSSFRDQEIVVLDGRFLRAGLTKIYPGFSGQRSAFAEEKPHFGWREAPGIPPLASLLTPPEFKESLSLLVEPLDDCPSPDTWRQGFWPEKRPSPGACAYAWVEAISRARRESGLRTYLLFHPGNQAHAEKMLPRPASVGKIFCVSFQRLD